MNNLANVATSMANVAIPGMQAIPGISGAANSSSDIRQKDVDVESNSKILGRYLKERFQKVINENDIVNTFTADYVGHFTNPEMKNKVVETYDHIFKIFVGVRVANSEETFKRLLFDKTIAKIHKTEGSISTTISIFAIQPNIIKKLQFILRNMSGGALTGKYDVRQKPIDTTPKIFKDMAGVVPQRFTQPLTQPLKDMANTAKGIVKHVIASKADDPEKKLTNEATNRLITQPSDSTEPSPAVKCFINKNTENIINSYITNETDAGIVNGNIQLSLVELIYEAFNIKDMRDKLCDQLYKHVDKHIDTIATNIVDSLCIPIASASVIHSTNVVPSAVHTNALAKGGGDTPTSNASPMNEIGLDQYQLLYVLLDEPLIQGYIGAINNHSPLNIDTTTPLNDVIKNINGIVNPLPGSKPTLVAKQPVVGVRKMNNILKDLLDQIVGESRQKAVLPDAKIIPDESSGGAGVSLTPADYNISQIIDQITTELFEGVSKRIKADISDEVIRENVLKAIESHLDKPIIQQQQLTTGFTRDPTAEFIHDRTYSCLIGSLCVRVRMHIFYKMVYDKDKMDAKSNQFIDKYTTRPDRTYKKENLNDFFNYMIPPKSTKMSQRGGANTRVDFKYTTENPYTISTPVYNLFSERIMDALKGNEFKKKLAMVALDSDKTRKYFFFTYGNIDILQTNDKHNMSDVFAKYIFVESVSFDWKKETNFRFVRANSDIMTMMKQLSVVYYGIPFSGNKLSYVDSLLNVGFRYFLQEYLYYSKFSTRIRENTNFEDLIFTLPHAYFVDSDNVPISDFGQRFEIDDSLKPYIQNMIYYAQHTRAYKNDTKPKYDPPPQNTSGENLNPLVAARGGKRRRTKRSTRRRRRRTRKIH